MGDEAGVHDRVTRLAHRGHVHKSWKACDNTPMQSSGQILSPVPLGQG